MIIFFQFEFWTISWFWTIFIFYFDPIFTLIHFWILKFLCSILTVITSFFSSVFSWFGKMISLLYLATAWKKNDFSITSERKRIFLSLVKEKWFYYHASVFIPVYDEVEVRTRINLCGISHSSLTQARLCLNNRFPQKNLHLNF